MPARQNPRAKNDDAPTTLSREDLYEQVWQTPARIGRRFWLSDAACGRWARLQHGKPVRKEPLPPVDAEDLRTVFLPAVHPSGSSNWDRSPGFRGGREWAPPRIVVEVRADLTDPHPLIPFSLREQTRREERPLIQRQRQERLDVAAKLEDGGAAGTRREGTSGLAG